MIPEQARLEIGRKRAAGETWTGIARWIQDEYGVEVHRTTVQRWHDKDILSEFELEESSDIVDSSKERLKIDKKLQTFKAESVYWKKMYEQSSKNEARKDVVAEIIQDLVPAFKAVRVPKPSNRKGKSDTEQIVVAPLTDTHVGDFVKADQMIGLNQYDIDIFNKRLSGWSESVYNLVELRRNIAPVNKLIVPMLGDMISGDIHDELARTNIDHCMGQMIRGANLIAQAIMFFAPHFQEIEVPCVVGNHGRMTRKPPMKDKFMDWDYMLYQWVATFCRDQKNIKFHFF